VVFRDPVTLRFIEALVQVERVSKRYETAIALDELTLDVLEGETLGLLGSNGAGKMTASRHDAGALPSSRRTGWTEESFGRWTGSTRPWPS
jgi:ABC-type multidrug transport system ATPase subunit